jgi:hypothetical protein
LSQKLERAREGQESDMSRRSWRATAEPRQQKRRYNERAESGEGEGEGAEG